MRLGFGALTVLITNVFIFFIYLFIYFLSVFVYFDELELSDLARFNPRPGNT